MAEFTCQSEKSLIASTSCSFEKEGEGEKSPMVPKQIQINGSVGVEL
jgi:hypothetical protein